MPKANELKEAQALGDLKVICVLFVVWNAFALLLDLPYEEQSPGAGSTMAFNPSHFSLVVAIALWMRSPAGRTLALIYTCGFLFIAFVIVFQLFPVGFFVVKGRAILPDSWVPAMRILIFPWCLTLLWQLFTLRRPEIRALFIAKRLADDKAGAIKTDTFNSVSSPPDGKHT